MNALTKGGRSGLPTTAAAPFSPALDRAVDLAMSPFPGVARDPVAPAVCQEAARHLAQLERAFRPCSHAVVREWLKPLAAAVRNPPDEETFDLKAAVITAACADVPDDAFTVKSQREALGKFAFFPAAADVLALFQDQITARDRKLRALRLVAESTPAGPPAPKAGDAERDAILAAFRPRFEAALAPVRSVAEQVEALRGPRVAKAVPLNRDQLAAAYRVAAGESTTLSAVNRARASRLAGEEGRK